MSDYELVIVGAGIAGMTAAIGASEEGIKKILIIEKEEWAGGILNQFINNGYGEKFLGEKVTGTEYINFLEEKLQELNIPILLNTTVLDISKDKVIKYVNCEDGIKEIKPKSIILALGSRETYSEAIVIPTNGLTGIFTLGEAHKIINLEGYLPGRKAIIIGKNKWSFIVAARLYIEGANIEGVIIENTIEEMQENNIDNIIEGFNIPIIENSRVIEIEGDTRIKKVKILNLESNEITEKECDSLLITVSFSPQTAPLKKSNIEIDTDTLGPKVTNFKTSIDGIFACGNIIYGEKALSMEETDGLECGILTAKYLKEV